MSRWTFLPIGGPYDLRASKPQDWNYDPDAPAEIDVDVAINDGYEWYPNPHRGVLVMLNDQSAQFNPDQLAAFIAVLQEAQRLTAEGAAHV